MCLMERNAWDEEVKHAVLVRPGDLFKQGVAAIIMRSLLARVDRVLGCEPGENYSRAQDDMVKNEKRLVAAVAPKIDEQLEKLEREYEGVDIKRLSDWRRPVLAMQKFIKGVLAGWVGDVAEGVLVKVQCFAVTSYCAVVYNYAEDPRVIVPYDGRTLTEWSDPLEYRKWPYWDEAIYYFRDTHRDSLAEFMGAEWVPERRALTTEDAMIQELWPQIHEERGRLMRAGEDSATKMLDMQTFVQRSLRKWSGHVADSVVRKVTCFAITYATFVVYREAGAGAKAYVVVEDPRKIVVDNGWMLELHLRHWRNYWDDVLDFLGNPDNNIRRMRYTLPAYMEWDRRKQRDRAAFTAPTDGSAPAVS